jgi:hypothetical protein
MFPFALKNDRTVFDHLTANRERHGEGFQLAVALKFQACLGIDDLVPLFGTNLPADLENLKTSLWDDDGQPVQESKITFPYAQDDSVLDIYQDAANDEGRILIVRSGEAKLSKFSGAFTIGHQMLVTFTATFPVSAKQFGNLGELWQKDLNIILEIEPRQGSLFDNDGEDGEE